MTSRATLAIAFGLALAAAVSLGLARFSYALLLPAMRADLGWNYLTAGAMNTANAAGYLAGALLAPRWLARHDARAVLLAGNAGAILMLEGHGLVLGDASLYALRFATGVASAASFVSGGLLAARLARFVAALVAARLLAGLGLAAVGLVILAFALILIIVALPALLLEARAILVEDAEIMVRILEIGLGQHPIASKLRVACHALVFLEQLGGVAALAIVLAVPRLSARVRASLSTATAPAAALTIVDQMPTSLRSV